MSLVSCRATGQNRRRAPRWPIVADFGPMIGVDLQTENVARLIQLALGPVFLINGVGITLGMLTSRLSRIVDRARTLELQRETANESTISLIDFDLKVIGRRARYINGAIILATASAFLTSLVVMLLFSSEFIGARLGGYIAGTFAAAMVGLSIAFLLFLLEVRIATRFLRIGGHIRP
jgi:hypothetical protein